VAVLPELRARRVKSGQSRIATNRKRLQTAQIAKYLPRGGDEAAPRCIEPLYTKGLRKSGPCVVSYAGTATSGSLYPVHDAPRWSSGCGEEISGRAVCAKAGGQAPRRIASLSKVSS
jgi:hypothetical protein